MRIVYSGLPRTAWWGKGMPHYQHNWFMKKGTIPDQARVVNEHTQFVQMIGEETDTMCIPFPAELENNGFYKHDFVFIRDHFISDQNGAAVLSNFSEGNRQREVRHTENFLKSLNLHIYTLPESARAEGGDFCFHAPTKTLFAGSVRNNYEGVKQTAKFLKARDVCIVQSSAFHLDSLLTLIIDSQHNMVAVLAGLRLIQNKAKVLSFMKTHGITVIDVLPQDCLGYPDKPGTLAVNCLALPGVLIGNERFETEGVESRIHHLGIRHKIVQTSQFRLSGGSVHCLTNELF